MKVEFAPGVEDDLRRIDWFERWGRFLPKTWYREVKYFIQRGRRGYSDRDLWNADGHIARTVIAFLQMGGKHGVSTVSTKEDEPFEKSLARWQKIEAELLWLMKDHLEDDWSSFSDPKYRKRRDRANRLFGKYWMSLWD